MVPYHTHDASIPNPSNHTWWLCGPASTKYRAGTCACRSCRLTSGFEIQPWAFIPRANILFPPSAPASWDFPTLPPGTLRAYHSSAGVCREFCPSCGATVFWHDALRPLLLDVSVGLLRAPDGARAEAWLAWWCRRVSFEDDPAAARPEPAAVLLQTPFDLIPGLKRGLLSWGRERAGRACDGES
jgi:hypothetical protein